MPVYHVDNGFKLSQRLTGQVGNCHLERLHELAVPLLTNRLLLGRVASLLLTAVGVCPGARMLKLSRVQLIATLYCTPF